MSDDTSNHAYRIAYTRRRAAGGLLRGLVGELLLLLTRTSMSGRKRFPKGGSLIVAGNHGSHESNR